MEDRAINLKILAETCKNYPEIISVKHALHPYKNAGDGLEIIVRSKIKYYDKELLELISERTADPSVMVTLENIAKVACENRYWGNGYYMMMLNHVPQDAYSAPYCDMGCMERRIMMAYANLDYDEIVGGLVLHTQSFEVSDDAKRRHFANYINQTKLWW